MIKVLFLCTGNSCRSQMAEGFLRTLGKGLFQAHSAGLMPAGVHPRAIAVMGEAGIDISGQASKTVEDAVVRRMDLVITLCDHAKEMCPWIPQEIRQFHWPVRDPVGIRGTDEEIMNDFRRARDEIRGKIEKLVQEARKNRLM